MAKNALLVLSDGSVFSGFTFGAEADAFGEVVFNTSMTGYQEMLTDPSYAGQIVMPTYPLIGNYGTNEPDDESRRIQVRGFIVREACTLPSHYLKDRTLHGYLEESSIPGLWGVDTRAITRKLRAHGVMMGVITSSMTAEQALAALKKQPDYNKTDFVREVTTEKPYAWPRPETDPPASMKIAAFDCGLKYNILRSLSRRGCAVTVFPCTAGAAEILDFNPDGILLSPGPGDPDLLDYAVETVKALLVVKPAMGICLGNQLIARAFGGRNFKLKFGHRGGNHPVKDLRTTNVYITAQNHGYAVDAKSLPPELEVTHINLNDNTVEGLRHRELPVFSIQYHAEASPGPLDNMYHFDEFVKMVRECKE
ncbi:glutamine-hydrolyzing carbamoyl-phosphate synthase small subunit [Chloroflexota bacterium]